MTEMRVRDIMSTQVYAVTPGEPLSRARNLMLRHKISRLLVLMHDEPVGMLTKADITCRLNQAEPQWRRRPIDQIPVQLVMTKSLIGIYPDATLPQACELLLENDIGGLVVRDDDLHGIITKWDMITYISKQSADIRACDIMSDFIAVVHRQHSVGHVIHTMDAEDVDRVVVLEYGGKPIGMITNSNLAFGCASDPRGRDKKFLEVPVVAEDIMSTPLITIPLDGLVTDAARTMVDELINSIIVLDAESDVIGILDQESILRGIIMLGE